MDVLSALMIGPESLTFAARGRWEEYWSKFFPFFVLLGRIDVKYFFVAIIAKLYSSMPFSITDFIEERSVTQ